MGIPNPRLPFDVVDRVNRGHHSARSIWAAILPSSRNRRATVSPPVPDSILPLHRTDPREFGGIQRLRRLVPTDLSS
jgi:hypothetical protein